MSFSNIYFESMRAIAPAAIFVYDIHRRGPGLSEMEPLAARPRGGFVMGVVQLAQYGLAEDPPGSYPVLSTIRRLFDPLPGWRSDIQPMRAAAVGKLGCFLESVFESIEQVSHGEV